MKEKFDWMMGLAKKNVTAALTTVVTPVSEYVTGMTMGQMLFKAVPVVGTTAAVVTTVGYLASKQNQANLEQQSAIQDTIDKLTQKKESIEQRMDKLENAQGNRKARQRYKKLASELNEVEFDISMEQDKLKEQGSSFLVRKTADAYDSVSQAVSSAVSHAVQNISGAYKIHGGGVMGLGHAVHETAKYVNQVPGISGYAKAGLHVLSGNVLDGGVEAVVHSYTGLTVNVTEQVVDVMAKTTAKELKNAVVGGVTAVMEEVHEVDQSLGYH